MSFYAEYKNKFLKSVDKIHYGLYNNIAGVNL